MTIKHFAKTAAYSVGMKIFPVKPNQAQQEELRFDDSAAASIQRIFAAAVKDDLKPTV